MCGMKDADKAIADYLAAHEAANGKPLDGPLGYERGWFAFYSPTGLFKRRSVRRAELDEMRRRLEWRASDDGKSFLAARNT